MENDGKGLFYGAIGVATLIVAIIGATFAYFTAAASNNNTITGTAAQAGLNLSVSIVSTDANSKPMVPQLTSTLQTAMAGTSNKPCVDGNGNAVCQIYSITINNTGTSASVLYGSIGFVFTGQSAKFDNLHWSKVDSATALGTGFSSSTLAKTAVSQGNLVNVTLQASGTATYYIVVWISEENTPQNTSDTGTFTGTVSFNSADGSGVTSTFIGS